MTNKIAPLLRKVAKSLKNNGKKKYALPDFSLASSESFVMMLELLDTFNPSTAIPILEYFISFTSNGRTCFSSNKTIAKETGCKVRMIQYFKEELKKAKIIRTRKKYGKVKFKDGHENYTTEIIFEPKAGAQLVALRKQIRSLKNFKKCSKLLKEVVIDNGLSFSDIKKFLNKELTRQIKPVHGGTKASHRESVHPYSSSTSSYKNLTPIGGFYLIKEENKLGSLYVGKATFNYGEYTVKMQEEGFNNTAIQNILNSFGHKALAHVFKCWQKEKAKGNVITYKARWAWRVARSCQLKINEEKPELYG